LVGGRPIISSYLTGKRAPGSPAVLFDILVLTQTPLVGVSVDPGGRVAWGEMEVAECVGVAMENAGALIVRTITIGLALTIKLADDPDKEGKINAFLLAVAPLAWR
jgi:hypothetical protein